MYTKFSEEVRKALIQAKSEMKKLKHPYVGSEHLMLAILKNEKNNITKILNNNGINYNNFKNQIIKVVGVGKKENEWYLYTPLLKRIIEESVALCKENNDDEVTLEHLINALIEEGEGVAIRIIICMNIKNFHLKKERRR